jgi:hypothetical protein
MHGMSAGITHVVETRLKASGELAYVPAGCSLLADLVPPLRRRDCLTASARHGPSRDEAPFAE